MNVSMVLTVNNRTPEVSKQVAEGIALPGNLPDELIVVLDRPTMEVKSGAIEAYDKLDCSVDFYEIFAEKDSERAWRGPAKAWNFGFKHATCDIIYCISSEVVQDARNLTRVRELCEGLGTAVFGACHNSVKKDLVVGAEPGLLVSSAMPRPLGFLVGMPRRSVERIGGFDEEFMDGFWYDDDDFFLRMWRTGITFTFDDGIHGVHLDHERPDLETDAGREGIKRNAEYMLHKHGTVNPWANLLRTDERSVEDGERRLVWRHI